MKRPFAKYRPIGPFYQQDSGLQGPFLLNIDFYVLRKLDASDHYADISTDSGKDTIKESVRGSIDRRFKYVDFESISFDSSRNRVNVILKNGNTITYSKHLQREIARLDNIGYAVFADPDDVNIEKPLAAPTRKPPNMKISIPVAFTKGEVGRNTLNLITDFASEKTEDDKSELVVEDNGRVGRFKKIYWNSFDTPPSPVTHKTKLTFQTNLSTVDSDFVSLLISNIQEGAKNVNDIHDGLVDVQGEKLTYTGDKISKRVQDMKITGM